MSKVNWVRLKDGLYSNYKEKGINELMSETDSIRFWNGYAYIPDGEDEICALPKKRLYMHLMEA